MRQRIQCVLFGAILAAFVLVGGCNVEKRPPAEISYYLIQPEFTEAALDLEGAPCVVLRPVTTQTSYRELFLMYRINEVEFETDYYNRFMASPPSQVTEAIRKWADSLNWTVCPEDEVDYDTEHYILRPVLEAFYGDFRDRGNPAAYAEIQLTLTHIEPTCNCSKVRLSNLYRARVPLASSSPAALVEAQGRAVREVLDQFSADLAGVLQ